MQQIILLTKLMQPLALQHHGEESHKYKRAVAAIPGR